jgi:energy-coupling factor transport system ATP-binding protein
VAELRASGVGFAFSGRSALFRGISLAIQAGETVVLLGGNASGKTTLLSILAGLVVPQEGKVEVDGVAIAEARQRVGILFQNPDHQMIAPTVEEEIALGLELRGTTRSEMRMRTDAMLKRFGIDNLRTRSPESLSGGQKQRVALAAVMIHDPAFLLFDEPDSFLDGHSRRDLMRAVEEIRGHVGILWATPNPRHCPVHDRLLFLETGAISELAGAELTERLCSETNI